MWLFKRFQVVLKSLRATRLNFSISYFLLLLINLKTTFILESSSTSLYGRGDVAISRWSEIILLNVAQSRYGDGCIISYIKRNTFTVVKLYAVERLPCFRRQTPEIIDDTSPRDYYILYILFQREKSQNSVVHESDFLTEYYYVPS